MCTGLFGQLSDITFEVTELLDRSEGHFALHDLMRGTAAGGRKVTMGSADVIVVANGQLKSVAGYFGTGTYLRQGGLSQ